jgi:integrase
MARKSYQKGTIIERSYRDGSPKFVLRYRERKPDGEWSEKTETLRGVTSRREAQRILDNRLREINRRNGFPRVQGNLEFSELLDKYWSNYLSNVELKPSTRSVWHSMTKNWIEPFFGAMKLSEIRPGVIGDFMAVLSEKRLSPKYRRNIYGVIKLMFDIAVESELMENTPVRPKLHRPRVPRRSRPVWSLEQARELLVSLVEPWKTPILVLALTGIRTGELLALRWKDVDFLNRRITIANSLWRGRLVSTKTDASAHTLAMSAALESVLKAHRSTACFTDPDDFLFCQKSGKPLDPDSLRRLGIYPALERAGIPFVKRASGCHAFRHLAGSLIHRKSGSIKLAQTQLGHASSSTTADIYTHVDEEELDQVAEILGDAFSKAVVSLWYVDDSSSEIIQ